MLGGEFRHNLDAKNRIFIPSKMREELGDTFVVAKALRQKCLMAYSLAGWDKYMAPIMAQNGNLRERTLRFLNATSAEVTPDSQGRIVLPRHLVDHAGIDKALVIVGCYDHAEIWSEAGYEQLQSEEDVAAMIAELESFGL
ncbi:MAG: division/cell wall cluster transcriptional repressor MraZ [Clostridia bacterium]|nr:division/cell wall cluster transcriptional repressor MraZ [Clostridia bacterium]